ncbi:putative large, multifunctional secreted protein [Pedobacter sp. BAL39]|uniref:3-keto-disaccharide hydrolase n=1 Tax=Pedobacter sp. BAL39 TaxID=391596 RepID=UPI000155A0BC|nr:DUF1080 domain-containing protein [Pedobacter sp. BAL39]EDM38430.1 putative large, multifunctional secreted protein [Pedobacter sp. BAL39]
MNLNYLKFGTTAFIWLLGTTLVDGQQLADKSEISLNDLSQFKDPGQTWSLAGGVTADLNATNALNTTKGTGILVNIPTKRNHGSDLLTTAEHGDLLLELDYLMAKGANSGIYLQGIYEVQLEDSWGIKNPLSSNNGGIYERWDDAKPQGQQGYGGYAPRQNASKAPGLWQHIKIAFRAPRFDGSGKKTENARILSLELNGVLIHENVELFGPTRGANSAEKPLGALRIQGDHGAVAFRNIKMGKVSDRDLMNGGRNDADPIYIDAPSNAMIRSFIDLPGRLRVVHAISVGTPQQVHYSYDLDNGLLLQSWRGEFIDATPMWHDRGDGSSRARGALTLYTKKPVPAIAKLATAESAWIADTTGTSFRTKGYVMDAQERPEFKYQMYGSTVTDAIKVSDNVEGLNRQISIDKPVENLYVLLAADAADIKEVAKGLYAIDDQSFYLRFDNAQDKPVIRDINGRKELVVLLRDKLNYSILF